MQHLIDIVLVAVVLLASLAYVVLALGPKSLRKRILGDSAKGGACGGCDDCGSTMSVTPAASGAEVRIPVGRIGRRSRTRDSSGP